MSLPPESSDAGRDERRAVPPGTPPGGPAPGRRTPETPESGDAAAQSLADALRVSFTVLTGIMILGVVFYLGSGVASIEPEEEGVKRVFGRIVGVADQGLAYTWPFPVGEIQRVGTSEVSVTVDEFWMHETPQDAATPIEQRRTRGKGLRPGYDGALLTGDRFLLHVRFKVRYNVVRPVRLVTALHHTMEPEEGEVAPPSSPHESREVKEAVRAAVCNAAVHAAALETSDSLMRSGQIKDFVGNVQSGAQAWLDKLDSGIELTGVEADQVIWPLRAMPDYRAFSEAVSRKEQQINQAKADAQGMIRRAAGPSAEDLVGTLQQVMVDSMAPSPEGENLIGQYRDVRRKQADAEQAGREQEVAALRERAEELLKRIDALLLSNRTGGEAQRVIKKAAAEGTAIRQRVESWHDQFVKLARECPTPRATAFQIESKWLEALTSIFEDGAIEQYVVSPRGKERMILRLSADPTVRKEIIEEIAREKAEQERRRRPVGPPPEEP